MVMPPLAASYITGDNYPSNLYYINQIILKDTKFRIYGSIIYIYIIMYVIYYCDP